MADVIYPKLIAAKLRSQMVYRASFAVDFVSQVMAQSYELIVILVLFSQINALGGFTKNEVLLMYAFAGAAFGVAVLATIGLEALVRGDPGLERGWTVEQRGTTAECEEPDDEQTSKHNVTHRPRSRGTAPRATPATGG